MMNKLILLVTFATLVVACCPKKKAIGMANPASKYCVDIGGSVEIVQGEKGRYGVCHFADGRVIEEWELYRSIKKGI